MASVLAQVPRSVWTGAGEWQLPQVSRQQAPLQAQVVRSGLWHPPEHWHQPSEDQGDT